MNGPVHASQFSTVEWNDLTPLQRISASALPRPLRDLSVKEMILVPYPYPDVLYELQFRGTEEARELRRKILGQDPPEWDSPEPHDSNADGGVA